MRLFSCHCNVPLKPKSLPLGVPPLGECPKDKGGAASGEVPPLGECPKDKGGAASGEEKVSTNGDG